MKWEKPRCVKLFEKVLYKIKNYLKKLIIKKRRDFL